MHGDEDALAAAGEIRAELKTLRAALARLEAAAERLPRRPARRRVERERPDRYYRVLVDVYERGGRHGISADELGGIGGDHGYDRRGLGGFFAGTRAPLRLLDGRARLTPDGLRLVDRYLQDVME